jgi:hypothetical protein
VAVALGVAPPVIFGVLGAWRPPNPPGIKVNKWLDLVDRSGQKLHVSPFFGSLQSFAEVAMASLPPEVLAEDPEAYAVLQLMLRGQAHALVLSPVPPQALLAQVDRG